jgi:Putative restriction endonuclease
MNFLDGAPEFAVEVRSEGDYGPAAERPMSEKRTDYFEAGTKVVWDVDLKGPDTVRVFRASDPDHPTVYRRGHKSLKPSRRCRAGQCRWTISFRRKTIDRRVAVVAFNSELARSRAKLLRRESFPSHWCRFG